MGPPRRRLPVKRAGGARAAAAVRCRDPIPEPAAAPGALGPPLPASQRGYTEVGGPCRSACSREPRPGGRAPVPLGAGGLPQGTGAGGELPGHGACGRARRRAGARGGGAGGDAHAGERPAAGAGWRSPPRWDAEPRQEPAPRRAGAARRAPGRGAQGTAGAPWGQARRARAQSCAKLFPVCAGPHWAFSVIVLCYGGFFPPIFPPFPLMASRAVAGGGPGSPPAAYPASTAFPSQNVSCSLPRPRGAGVQAALPLGPPGLLPRHPLSPPWGFDPQNESPFQTRKPFRNCLGSAALG